MDILNIELKLPECIKDQEIKPMTKEEAREFYDKIYMNNPDGFHLLPLPAFYLIENEHIAEDRDVKSKSFKFILDTCSFYESIKDLPEEEQKEKIRERNERMNIKPKKVNKVSKKSIL
jgi:hypothetical protein